MEMLCAHLCLLLFTVRATHPVRLILLYLMTLMVFDEYNLCSLMFGVYIERCFLQEGVVVVVVVTIISCYQ
jgi:hypothetical protein